MKVYISADMEGTAGIAHWDETELSRPDYQPFRELMTDEVAAACRAVMDAGGREIVVKDAHGSGRNLILSRLPEAVAVIRGWSGHPFSMMQELDDSFSAVLMTGYHAAASTGENPLAHSFSLKLARLTINGRIASEFLVNALTAAYVGVPVIFISGDAGICRAAEAYHAAITTCPVSRGVGDSCIGMTPKAAATAIHTAVSAAMKNDPGRCAVPLPDSFSVGLVFRDARDAYTAAFYPGMTQTAPHETAFSAADYFEVLRMLMFVH